jgi:hypothetical protein
LAVVLYEIAKKAGVPFKLSGNTAGAPVDLDLMNASFEQLAEGVGPGVKIFVRKDLQSLETVPLRVVFESGTSPEDR